jgi:hypothetical protein
MLIILVKCDDSQMVSTDQNTVILLIESIQAKTLLVSGDVRGDEKVSGHISMEDVPQHSSAPKTLIQHSQHVLEISSPFPTLMLLHEKSPMRDQMNASRNLLSYLVTPIDISHFNG